MKKSLVLSALVCALLGGIMASEASAQDANSFRRFDINWNAFSYSRQGSVDQYGGTLGFTYHMNEKWGFVADLGRHEPSNDLIRATTYRFGPRLSNRVGTRVKTFGQLLVGGARLTVPSVGSTNGFSMLMGGGVDIGIKPWFAVRAIEGGYSGIHVSGGGWSNGARLSSGVLLRFGKE
jgi:hypothetical protein